MKKQKKVFLHDTDSYTDVASYKVETLNDATIDTEFAVSDGRNEFQLWDFLSTQGDYDDVMTKIDNFIMMLGEFGLAITQARKEVEFDA